jgi:pyruvate,water dikinase
MVANKGIVRGIARITMSAKEAGEIKKGEILITSMTTPDFVTAMKRAVAIVTNEGGVLCHAAVVSRELGLPCIVGTRIATKIFKTGDIIEVDGNLGVVRKVT